MVRVTNTDSVHVFLFFFPFFPFLFFHVCRIRKRSPGRDKCWTTVIRSVEDALNTFCLVIQKVQVLVLQLVLVDPLRVKYVYNGPLFLVAGQYHVKNTLAVSIARSQDIL